MLASWRGAQDLDPQFRSGRGRGCLGTSVCPELIEGSGSGGLSCVERCASRRGTSLCTDGEGNGGAGRRVQMFSE